MQNLNNASRGANPVRAGATLIGSVAVLMWSSLASLTAAATGIPPLQLLATTFGIAFICGMMWLLMTGGRSSLRRLKQPLPYLGFAAMALFGYHALYFVALSLAPAAQASLVAYLWPLLIVLFSTWDKRAGPIRVGHIGGAVLGLTGTALLVLTAHGGAGSSPNHPLGLLAALACALIWSGYSVLNRRFRQVSSDAMVEVCGLVAALGWVAHWLLDRQTLPPNESQWAAIAALGVGPVGLAFLAWDHGTKHGDLRLLSTLSYAAPVLSTLLLVMLGYAAATLNLLVACVLVVGGAWIASASSRPA
jgi:drug/metabolite transporter (DMT)-like permease